MHFTSFISTIGLLAAATPVLASPVITARSDSAEALYEFQYFTTSWLTYTATLNNVSSTYNLTTPLFNTSLPHYNTTLLPATAKATVIKTVSRFNMGFEYESYVVARIAAGGVFDEADSEAAVVAAGEMVDAMAPVMGAFAVFVDIIGAGEDGLEFMVGELKGAIGPLVTAVVGVVSESQLSAMEMVEAKYDAVVVALTADFGSD